MSEFCQYCHRSIVYIEAEGQWIDPEADGDDSIWRDYCDSNDTERAAPHEPVAVTGHPTQPDRTYGDLYA